MLTYMVTMIIDVFLAQTIHILAQLPNKQLEILLYILLWLFIM